MAHFHEFAVSEGEISGENEKRVRVPAFGGNYRVLKLSAGKADERRGVGNHRINDCVFVVVRLIAEECVAKPLPYRDLVSNNKCCCQNGKSFHA